MKKYFPNIKNALILTPAIFILAMWILLLSTSDILLTLGRFNLTLWAILLSFGIALSISTFAAELLKKNN
jgi:hypothetical protein